MAIPLENATPMTMLAERFYVESREIKLERVPVPVPGPGEVRIKVAYCGICHSDLSLIDGHFPSRLPVITQGHEVSGWIDEIGPGVSGWEVGDAVIPSAGRTCTACRNCRRGNFGECLALQLMAFSFDGGWAEYVVVGATGLTRVPEGVPMDQAAILADAVSTPLPPSSGPPRCIWPVPWVSGAWVGWAATWCSCASSPERCRSSPSTSTTRHWCAPVGWERTSPSGPTTPSWVPRSRRRPEAG